MTRVYKFLSTEFGLKTLYEKRLKISTYEDLNDPTELLIYKKPNLEARKASYEIKAQLNEKWGILSFSEKWDNPLMWAHYADKHKGLCLGFDIDENARMNVTYVDDEPSYPETTKDINESFTKVILTTKFRCWDYENEFRAHADFNNLENGIWFTDIGDNLLLKEVFIGVRSKLNIDDIKRALKGYEDGEKIFIKPVDEEDLFKMSRTKV